MTDTASIQAMLISVGGAQSPILHVLSKNRPKHVWYFCSTGSRKLAEEIQSKLDWHPQARFIEVDRFEELGPCYRELRHKIPEILRETRVNPDHVVVDYTGGTKTMSASLVLMAVELFKEFSYVGGEQREKGGLGITVDGKERILYQGNPWTDLAIREIERARDLWASYLFYAVSDILRDTAKRISHQLRFEALAELSDAMAARHRLDFSRAKKLLGPLIGNLPPLYDGYNDYGLLEFVRQALNICQTCASHKASETFLRELLDNVLRTAKQKRFEDAAARLYRAMEMQVHIWLANETNNLFINGRCRAENISRVPAALRALPFCVPDRAGDIKLGLEDTIKALAALGHQRVQRIVEDIEFIEVHSRWRVATEKRNASVLAHGVMPIGEEGFNQMAEIAHEFLDFELDREHNPIPELDARWFSPEPRFQPIAI